MNNSTLSFTFQGKHYQYSIRKAEQENTDNGTIITLTGKITPDSMSKDFLNLIAQNNKDWYELQKKKNQQTPQRTPQKSEYICSDCGSIIVKRSEFLGIRNQTRIVSPGIGFSGKEKTVFELEIDYLKNKKLVCFETKEELEKALKSFMANL